MPLKPLPPEETAPEPPRKPYVPAPEEAEGFEYEVDEVDPAVIAYQQARAREDLARAQAAIDVDEVYRELDRNSDLDFTSDGLRKRFGVRGLLAVTTGVAVLLTIARFGVFSARGAAQLIVVSLLVLGAAHAWLGYRERVRQGELIARRERQLREARRYSGGSEFEKPDPIPKPAPANPFAGMLRLRRFTLGEALGATAGAAVALALLRVSGSPAQAAAAIGVIALIGFAVQAADVEPPRPLVLAWWLTLVGYCGMALVAAASGSANPGSWLLIPSL